MPKEDHEAARVRRAAEAEHTHGRGEGKRRESDTASAQAHPTMTDTRLRRGHPPGGDWRDNPVDEERGKDVKDDRGEGSARKRRGNS